MDAQKKDPDPADPKCWEGGAIGGPDYRFPTDPTHYRRGEGELTCCNRLWCPSCKVWVRHADGVRIAGWMTPADRDALYDAPYPENTKYVGPGGQGTSFRTYFCRCSAEDVISFRQLDMTDSIWTCGGHPQSP